MTWDFSINLPPLPPPELPDPRVERARRAPGTQGLSDNVLRMVSTLEDIASAQASLVQLHLGRGDERQALDAFAQAKIALSYIDDDYARFATGTRVFNRVDREAHAYGSRALRDAVTRARIARMNQQ